MEHDYLKLLKDILDTGIQKEDRTGTGTISIFGRQIRHKMSEGFPLLTTKKMPFKTIVTELLWFLRGDTNIKYLHDNNCHIWDGDYIKSGRTDGELGPIYGSQWRSWGRKNVVNYDLENVKSSDKVKVMDLIRDGSDYSKYDVKVTYQNNSIDQIQNLINDLKTNPDSRRLMVSAWNVGELDQMTLPPCHYGFQVYTRELSFEERIVWMKDNSPTREVILPQSLGPEFSMDEFFEPYGVPKRAISLMWNQRSVDTFLGLPFNIASYGLLLQLIAREVNMVADELIGNLGDTHLYLNHIEQAKEQIGREPFELPTINFNTEWWDKPFFEAINNESFCKCLLEEDIQLGNYKSHPAIKATLSN